MLYSHHFIFEVSSDDYKRIHSNIRYSDNKHKFEISNKIIPK